MNENTDSAASALVDGLLAALDPLPYPRRARHIALWARERAAAGELIAVLAELSGRGAYEHGVAALAASVGRDTRWLQDRLADPDPVVRARAMAAVRQASVPDAAVVAALEDAPTVVRRALVRAVVAGRRTALADALIRPLREHWGDAEAARLLPACSAGTVTELLPGLFHAIVQWEKLARHHSSALLDEAERRLTAARSEDNREIWWRLHGAVVGAAVETAPSRVLDLLERLCPGPLPGQVSARLGQLAAADPEATLRVLLAPGRQDTDRLWLRTPVLRTLIRHRPPGFADFARALSRNDRALVRLLRLMPPSERSACYDTAMGGRSTRFAFLSDALLGVLPRERREAEARRMAAQAREHGSSWQMVLSAVSFLPVAEGREELLTATRRSEAMERAYAYPLLVRNAALTRDPSAVTELLAGLRRLRNEQEPVRAAALKAIAAIRPALFAAEAAPHLERLATDALEARDFSWNDHSALHGLAHALLREHASGTGEELTDWAYRTLARLPGASGGFREESLRKGQEHELFEALRPSLEAAAGHADFTEVIRLATALGDRAHDIAGLQALLRRCVEHGTAEDGRKAADLWLDDPRTRDDRIVELLALDPSTATFPAVIGALAVRRTDLLDAVLGDTPPYGRFLTKDRHWLPPIGRHTAFWLPRQQAAAARLLERAVGDSSLSLAERVYALPLAAWIPEYGTELLVRYAGDDNVPIAETALAALGRTTDPGRHLPLLLSHVGGDRARVAVPAASRASRYTAPSGLSGVLRDLLTAATGVKVTSRKEAARLAAVRLPAAQAVALLAEAMAAPGQHHDVQAACVTVTTGLLAHEAAWGLLESAASGRRELRRAVLGPAPGTLPERHRCRYAGLVRTVCVTDDPDLARQGFQALGTWSRWAPDAVDLLVAAVTDLDNRASWQSAARALCSYVAYAPSGSPDLVPLTRALTALMEADALPGTPDAEEDRDRPAFRRIQYVTTVLAELGGRQRRTVGTAAPAIADLLTATGRHAPEAAALLVRTLDLGAEPDELTAQLTRLARVHEGRPALATRTADTLTTRIGRRDGSDTALLHAAAALADDGEHAAGLFALALTVAGGRRGYWSTAWRDQLRALRRHPHADVRDEALRTVTAEE
ncbi:hypothetical protein [Streptomyces sp. NPDC053048]|uniref:hypothetical protein n=1 Tax=Streptomyces sp. NPDC053048 TaxID=3365694 RepID=UPI0037D66E1F